MFKNTYPNIIVNITSLLNLLLRNKYNVFTMKLNIFLFIAALFFCANCEENKMKSWKEKNIMDMTDADMERLLDQWEEGDEPLESDEMPEHLRPSPTVDFSQIDPSDPDSLLRATKLGKNVMMFVDVKDDISHNDAENILRLWQGSLQNNHIIIERYPIEAKRAVFMFREGSQAVDGKNFLIDQPELERVTLEGRTYYGKNSKEKRNANENKSNVKSRSEEL